MPFNTEIILNTELKIRTYITQMTEKKNSVCDIQDHVTQPLLYNTVPLN